MDTEDRNTSRPSGGRHCGGDRRGSLAGEGFARLNRQAREAVCKTRSRPGLSCPNPLSEGERRDASRAFEWKGHDQFDVHGRGMPFRRLRISDSQRKRLRMGKGRHERGVQTASGLRCQVLKLRRGGGWRRLAEVFWQNVAANNS